MSEREGGDQRSTSCCSVWDAASEKQLDVVTQKDSQINCLGLSPDGAQLAAGGWERVRMFDMAAGGGLQGGHHAVAAANSTTAAANANAASFTVHEKNVTTLGYQADGAWM